MLGARTGSTHQRNDDNHSGEDAKPPVRGALHHLHAVQKLEGAGQLLGSGQGGRQERRAAGDSAASRAEAQAGLGVQAAALTQHSGLRWLQGAAGSSSAAGSAARTARARLVVLVGQRAALGVLVVPAGRPRGRQGVARCIHMHAVAAAQRTDGPGRGVSACRRRRRSAGASPGAGLDAFVLIVEVKCHHQVHGPHGQAGEEQHDGHACGAPGQRRNLLGRRRSSVRRCAPARPACRAGPARAAHPPPGRSGPGSGAETG